MVQMVLKEKLIIRFFVKTENDEKMLDKIFIDIAEIANLLYPPEKSEKSICKKCAYYDLCMI